MGQFRKVLLFLSRILWAAMLLPILCGCARTREPAVRTAFVFDTAVTVTLYDDLPAEEAAEILDACVRMAEDLDHRHFSAHDSNAEIWQANHAGGEAVPISTATRDLLVLSLYWAGQTENAFLPTMGALSALWNFTGDPPGPVPQKSEITRALAHTSTHSIHVESPEDMLIPEDNTPADAQSFAGQFIDDTPAALVRIDDKDLMIDLGGIAKGYAADLMKAYLTGRGVKSAIINLGGNVLLVGSRPDGSDFQVGIQDPGLSGEPVTGQPLFSIAASDVSIVTSGVYERYFEENGVRYHHILDPATGYPADTGLLSVTVISPDSASGDALATALLVMGAEKGQALAERLPDIEALFITKDGQRIKTPGFPDTSEIPAG